MLPSNALGSARGLINLILSKLIGWPEHEIKDPRPTAWLDGLRGVAAFEVLIFHYSDFWVEGDPGFGSSPDHMQFYRLPLFRSLWYSGRCMVCTFFVISGFVLTQRSLLALRQRRLATVYNGLSSAVFRRGIRLFPPALLVCAFGFVLVRLGFRGSPEDGYLPYYDSLGKQLWHWIAETCRFLNVFGWHPRSFGGELMHKYEAVVWSLPMEFIGSMAIYIVMIGTARLTPRLRLSIIAILALVGCGQGCWSILCFYGGIILADWQIAQESDTQTSSAVLRHPAIRTTFWSAILVQGIWMAGAPMRGYKEEGQIALGFNTQWALMPEKFLAIDINYTGWSIAGLLLVLSISRLPYAQRILETTFCQYLGKISFSLYLNHVWTRDILGHWLQKFFESIFGDVYPGIIISCALWYMVMITFNFIVAGAFERIIDAPLVRFAKTFEKSRVILALHEDRVETNIHDDEHELAELLPPNEENDATFHNSDEAQGTNREKATMPSGNQS